MKTRTKGLFFFATLLTFGALQAAAQTDVAFSGYVAFNQSTSSSTTLQSPSDQGGFLLELRHISNPIVGYELTYAYNRANQGFHTAVGCPVFESCSTTAAIPANAHEVSADWVVSLKVLMLRPFALAGPGVLVTSPQGGTVTTTACSLLNALCQQSTTPAPTQTQAKAEFVYGAGVDWPVIPHLGLRFQYRGRVSKAPDVVTAFSSTNSFTKTASPVFGAYLRF